MRTEQQISIGEHFGLQLDDVVVALRRVTDDFGDGIQRVVAEQGSFGSVVGLEVGYAPMVYFPDSGFSTSCDSDEIEKAVAQ